MSQNKIDFSKYKELLNNILKISFENKLKILEERTKTHLSIISSTKDLTKDITSLTVKLHNQITMKKKYEKINSVNKYKKNPIYKNITPKSSLIKSASRFKTPLRTIKRSLKAYASKSVLTTKKLDSKIKNHLYNNKTEKIKSLGDKTKNFYINKRNKTIEGDNEIFYKTFMQPFNINIDKDNESDISSNKGILKRRRSFNSFKIGEKYIGKEAINKNNSENNNIIRIKDKNKNKNKNTRNKTLKYVGSKFFNNTKDKFIAKTFERKKSKNSFTASQILKKVKKSKEKSQNMLYKNKNKKKDILNKNKISMFNLETNLQEDIKIYQDDPLLINPISNIDLEKNELIPNSKDSKNSDEIKNIIDLCEKEDEKHIQNIFEYLEINDLIILKTVSKSFKKFVLNYFLKHLNETKSSLENLLILANYSSEPKDFKNFVLSKGATKSIELLNETIMNKIFKQTNTPRNDILFIYKVFFQLINNSMKDLNNKDEFWENCRQYFLNDGKGKIGDFLKDKINNNKIDISDENLYKLYKLVKNKLHIITPSYFNKVCSTTALITFYLKDILIFLGISMEKEDIKQNGYWTYLNILNSIDKKINIL